MDTGPSQGEASFREMAMGYRVGALLTVNFAHGFTESANSRRRWPTSPHIEYTSGRFFGS